MRQGIPARRDPIADARARAGAHEARQRSAYTLRVLVRSWGPPVDEATKSYIRGRMGFKLGKFADYIDRVFVKVSDVNGPRGGEDIACQIKVVFFGLESIVYESQSVEVRAAFDRAVDRVEYLVTKLVARAREHREAAEARPSEPASSLRRKVPLSSREAASSPAAEGERVGRQEASTAEPPQVASERPGAGPSTYGRPTRNMARATYALEESATGQPSRKSTRKSANRSKPDSNLARRNLRKVGSPAERAARASAVKP